MGDPNTTDRPAAETDADPAADLDFSADDGHAWGANGRDAAGDAPADPPPAVMPAALLSPPPRPAAAARSSAPPLPMPPVSPQFAAFARPADPGEETAAPARPAPAMAGPRRSGGDHVDDDHGGDDHGDGSTRSTGGGPPPDPSADGLLRILLRQWPLLAASTLLALLAGSAYLLLARPTYTASAKLRVAPLDTRSITGDGAGGGGAGSPAEAEDFLATECEVIRSDAVLALALDAVGQTRALAGSARPMDALKAHLDAAVARHGRAIEVSFEAHSPRDAERVVAAVVAAYRSYNADYWKAQGEEYIHVLQEGSGKSADEMAHKQELMAALARQYQFTPGADPERTPAHEAVASLRAAKLKADLDAITARGAYQEAARGILGDPAQVAAVEAADRAAVYTADPADKLKLIQDELLTQQTRLADAEHQYLPGHPIVRTIRARIDQLAVAAVVAAKQWQQVAEGRQRELGQGLADAQQAEVETVKNQLEYVRLEADVARLKHVGDEVDNRMHVLEVGRSAGAITISVLDAPAVDWLDVRPHRAKTLAIAAALGLLAGAGLACARDLSDDRLRSTAAVRAAAGAPVLGAIPSIATADAPSPVDRGRVVHHDPFGEAAESYRTLRTALQFGLPPRTKTVLVTSPRAGDGKSTLVSNLAIACAQSDRRVVVVDADLRAPVQHALFGLGDRVGLATVLDGAAELDEAVRRTDVPGLDVLPAGPVPSNPAEMLNRPAFADLLNELADRYDLVLVDSPPVTAVTDARIIAASADASLLVVRLGATTRRQTGAARDGLRSVGARVAGVAIVGAGRSNPPSATGYYARPAVAPAVQLAASAPASADRRYRDALGDVRQERTSA